MRRKIAAFVSVTAARRFLPEIPAAFARAPDTRFTASGEANGADALPARIAKFRDVGAIFREQRTALLGSQTNVSSTASGVLASRSNSLRRSPQLERAGL